MSGFTSQVGRLERTLGQISDELGGVLTGDRELVITGLAGILDAQPGEITFLAASQYRKYLAETRASAIVVAPDFEACELPTIRVAGPERAFEKLVEWFRVPRSRPAVGVHPQSVIEPGVDFGEGVAIGPHVSIGANSRLGARVVLHAGVRIGEGVSVGEGSEIHCNAILGDRVVVGARVIVHGNAVLGADGFGFRPGPRGLEKLEQIGTVVIGDDVEIGAGTTIDRARYGRTVVGRGTKIDNLVQIAHNVRIGSNCVIAAQSGISGSTILGDRCMLGGQVGTVGHVRVGDGCMITARSGISKDTPAGSKVYGFVAGPHLAKKREEAAVRQLPSALKRIRELERRLGIDSGESSPES